ncbi:MAG: hypothetical protein JW841_08955 [Deltaproteobacteria bacterium]|nr:hypothetical protein [Deltaproteobacteria bacterium]
MTHSNPHTYFFREVDALYMLRDNILLSAANIERPISIWCAGCASGEEPYTIAMLAKEVGAKVEILGTDINTSVINHAKSGHYRENSLRHMPPQYKRLWFSQKNGGFEINSNLKQIVTFSVHDFLTSNLPRPRLNISGIWDIILCRNALIYHEAPEVAHAVAGFISMLNSDGFLVLGACEWLDSRVFIHLHSLCAVEAFEQQGTLCYRASDESKPLLINSAPLISTTKNKSLTKNTTANHQPIITSQKNNKSNSKRRRGDMLLDEGKVNEALEAYNEILVHEDLAADIHLRIALCLLLLNTLEEARKALRRSLFLEPELWPAAILLGDIVTSTDPILAVQSYKQAATALNKNPEKIFTLKDYESLTPFLMPQHAAIEAVNLRLNNLSNHATRR